MKFKRVLMSFVCALALLAQSSLGVLAQDKVEKRSERSVIVQTDNGGNATFNIRIGEPQDRVLLPAPVPNMVWTTPGGQGDTAFQFFSTEMGFDTRLVKGAPLSATIISETIQTLADGNRIVQRSEGRLYRDSQGRTRQERTFQMGGSNLEHQTVTILDPVSGQDYVLDPSSRTARRMFARILPPPPPPAPVPSKAPADTPNLSAEAPKQIKVSGGVLQGSAIKKAQPVYPPVAKAANASGAVQVQVTIGEDGRVIDTAVLNGHPLLRDAAQQAARQWEFKPTELAGKPVKVQGILTFNFTLEGGTQPPAPLEGIRRGSMGSTNTEELGKQMIEGVECTGTRHITTIPAGAIGNERPLETVRETWYSPELKLVIMSKQTDPRFGESNYRMTNISRHEPEATLFQVPADYTFKEGDNLRIMEEKMQIERLREDREEVLKRRKPNDQ